MLGADGCVSLRVECLCCVHVWLARACCLMRSTAGAYSRVVDVYNGNTGAWSLAQLSDARGYIAATSIGNVALFAGGIYDGGALLWKDIDCCRWLRVALFRFFICNCSSIAPRHSSIARCYISSYLHFTISSFFCIVGVTTVVDICTASSSTVAPSTTAVPLPTSALPPSTPPPPPQTPSPSQGTWSTAQLSLSRGYLVAASVTNTALFAGGFAGGAFMQKDHV
jgi:hypothetical protein